MRFPDQEHHLRGLDKSLIKASFALYEIMRGQVEKRIELC